MSQWFENMTDGDFSDWQLSPETPCNLALLRFVRGPQDLLQKFRDHHVPSWVREERAELQSGRKVEDLASRLGVPKIHTLEKYITIAASLNEYARTRVALSYPAAPHGEALVQSSASSCNQYRSKGRRR